MNLPRRLLLAVMVALLFSAAVVSLASAHNAGHIILPSGQCLNVGSLKDAPLVPAANPNRNDLGQLDLIDGPSPDTGDQYGARFAAIQGSTPILPGECP